MEQKKTRNSTSITEKDRVQYEDEEDDETFFRNDKENRSSHIEMYENNFANPYKAAELGYIDEVINPEITRSRLYQYLRALENKVKLSPKRKHGNIPL